MVVSATHGEAGQMLLELFGREYFMPATATKRESNGDLGHAVEPSRASRASPYAKDGMAPMCPGLSMATVAA